jgi:hypothetical protein
LDRRPQKELQRAQLDHQFLGAIKWILQPIQEEQPELKLRVDDFQQIRHLFEPVKEFQLK